MASKNAMAAAREEEFWREFPTMTDYFSPAILPMMRSLGLSSKELMHGLGEMIGRTAAAKMPNLSVRQMLDEFSKMWDRYEIGRLTVERDNPLVLQISNCTVCGQLPGTGEMYECAFHEGFFQGALSSKASRPVALKQDTNYAGEAGTWCRRLEADLSL